MNRERRCPLRNCHLPHGADQIGQKDRVATTWSAGTGRLHYSCCMVVRMQTMLRWTERVIRLV